MFTVCGKIAKSNEGFFKNSSETLNCFSTVIVTKKKKGVLFYPYFSTYLLRLIYCQIAFFVYNFIQHLIECTCNVTLPHVVVMVSNHVVL